MSLTECKSCHKEYPISWFPRPQEELVCRACMMADAAGETEKVLDEKAKSIAKRMAGLTNSEIEPELKKVRTVLSEIYDNFGGTSGYAEQLHWVVMKLCERKEVPASAAQILINILKLHHSVETAEEVVDARKMTDEQLKRESEIAVMKMTMEAVSDPEKFKALQSMLGPKGIQLIETEPHERIKAVKEVVEQDEG